MFVPRTGIGDSGRALWVVCRSVRSRILPIQEIQLEIFSNDVCARRKSAGSRATQHAMDVELERLSPNNHFSL
jgi:hypothetical protein